MDRQTRWVGWFAILLGMGAAISGGKDLLFGQGDLPSGLSCRGICGLSLIVSELLGEAVGQRLFAVLWLVIGSASAAIGVKLLRNR